MTLEEARRIAMILHDTEFTPWMAESGDGYSVNFIVDGVLYEINEKK
jgi:hypothetical protein